jgi:two-component sensor histidine kinase
MPNRKPERNLAPEEMAHIQRMLKIIILAVTAVLVLISGIDIAYRDWNEVWALTAAGIVLWASYGFVRRGFPGGATFIIALSLLTVTTYASTFGQGIHDIGIIAYPGILVVASLLLRLHSYIFLLLVSILSIGWLTLGETAGLYRPRPNIIGDFSDFVIVSGILLVTALMSHLISDGMWKGLRQARKEIQERGKIELELKKGLREKEILLKEVHHRVKNNLNVILSLLNLQEHGIRNKAQAMAAFQESRNRIHAMALVHEKLYQSADLSRVDVGEYVNSLASRLLSVHGLQKWVSLDVRIERVFLDINTAVPLGLILNELITNAMKHAFRDRKKGRLHVAVKLLANDRYDVVVRDDGRGLPPEVDWKNPGSMGLQLVSWLVQQLGGTLSVTSDKGACFRFSLSSPAQIRE